MKYGLILALAATFPLAAFAEKSPAAPGKSPAAHSKNAVKKAVKDEWVVCPVMKQKVKKSKAIKMVHNGKSYYLCCPGCKSQIASGKVK